MADFTIEFWTKISSNNSQTNFFNIGTETSLKYSASVWTLKLAGSNKTTFSYSLPLNTWTHIAITRSNTTVKLFIGGVAKRTYIGTSDNINDTSGLLTIGNADTPDSTKNVKGYISNFHIVKGTSLYNGNTYTPSTAIPTTISGQSVLLMDFYDNDTRFLEEISGNGTTKTISNSGVVFNSDNPAGVGNPGSANFGSVGSTNNLTVSNDGDFAFGLAGADLTPTPTPTQTATPTSSITATPSLTPSTSGPATGYCVYEWSASGSVWNNIQSLCSVGYECGSAPGFNGTFDGQRVNISCVFTATPPVTPTQTHTPTNTLTASPTNTKTSTPTPSNSGYVSGYCTYEYSSSNGGVWNNILTNCAPGYVCGNQPEFNGFNGQKVNVSCVIGVTPTPTSTVSATPSNFAPYSYTIKYREADGSNNKYGWFDNETACTLESEGWGEITIYSPSSIFTNGMSFYLDSSGSQIVNVVANQYYYYSDENKSFMWVAGNTISNIAACNTCNSITLVGLNANTTSNSAISTHGGGWTASAYSTETYTSPVSVTFKTSASDNYLMGGFSYTPTSNSETYINTTYGLYIQPGFLEIYEYGGQVNVPGSITRSVNDIWKVDYNGTNVKYYQNNTLIYTSSNIVNQPLHVFFPLLTGGAGVTDVCVNIPAPTPTPTPTPTATPVNPNDLIFDSNYLGDFIVLSNYDCTASFTSDTSENETSVLTNYRISDGQKVVFSMVTTYGGTSDYTGVGVANRQFNVNNYLGGTNSIGLYDGGELYYALLNNNGYITLDLNFQQDGNIVDVAVDRVNNLIWFRVDGGYWNGDETQDPETASGGIDISGISGDVYPGACPYAYDGIFGLISINNRVSNPPAGFTVLKSSHAPLINRAFSSQIYLSDSNITSIKLGNDDVSKIFLGDVLVFGGVTPTPTATPTPTPTPTHASFGSSGFQWMNINSVTSNTASGIGQNNITISITQTGGGMASHNGMVGGSTFPETYGVPLGGTQILNSQSGIFTAVFSQPVTDALVAFASVGQPGLSVPVQVSTPFTPVWSTDTTYQNAVNGTQYSQFTGEEGYNIIRIDGTVTTVTFNYTVSEYYCTVCFGFVDQNA